MFLVANIIKHKGKFFANIYKAEGPEEINSNPIASTAGFMGLLRLFGAIEQYARQTRKKLLYIKRVY